LERDERFRSRLVLDVLDAETRAPVDPIAVDVIPVGPALHESWAAPTVVRRPGGATIEPLHPRDWRVWVRVGRAIVGEDFRIEEGEAEVHVTIPVGRPGILSGRVEIDAEDAPERPLVLFLFGDGNRVGGTEWQGGSLLDAYDRVEPDGSFRLEDVSPG